jgi:hypothetical protein
VLITGVEGGCREAAALAALTLDQEEPPPLPLSGEGEGFESLGRSEWGREDSNLRLRTIRLQTRLTYYTSCSRR